MKKITIATVAVAITIGIVTGYGIKAFAKPKTIVKTITVTEPVTEPVAKPIYIIRDVWDVTDYHNGTSVICAEMGNGDLELFFIDSEDLPEEIKEVVFEVTDLDDYNTYKIVGLR